MHTLTRITWRLAAVAFSVSLFAACGSDDGGGGSPTTPSGSGPGPIGATITIGTNGAVSPSSVTISVGQSVSFVNSHNASHDMASDPHPAHTNCPSINALGLVGAGQTKPTNSFGAAGTCGFHDHNNPDDPALKGTITIR